MVLGGWRREWTRVGSTGAGFLRGDKNVLRLDSSEKEIRERKNKWP